jgi:carbamoyl-phosphate synthase small subunit
MHAAESSRKVRLTLDDGSWIEGRHIGAPLVSSGELVFTTGMVGYHEALTDPSFFGQILIFSYPLIGNYGVPASDGKFSPEEFLGMESNKIHVSGVIMTVESAKAFHWATSQTIEEWLLEQGVPGIVGVDTRQLVKKVRDSNKVLGIISPENAEGTKKLHPDISMTENTFFDSTQYKIIDYVSSDELKSFGKGKKRAAILDCGVKWNIIRNVLERGWEVQLVPWDYDLKKIDTDAWIFSNGPGDPEKELDLAMNIQNILAESIPSLGICLGHQLLSLAAGAKTKRLEHGHRGHNQPVFDCENQKGYMTSQNHGYVVDESSIPEEWTPWFKNANDGSIEGVKHLTKHFWGVQFHPEAAGGPNDTSWIFDQFLEKLEAEKY